MSESLLCDLLYVFAYQLLSKKRWSFCYVLSTVLTYSIVTYLCEDELFLFYNLLLPTTSASYSLIIVVLV